MRVHRVLSWAACLGLVGAAPFKVDAHAGERIEGYTNFLWTVLLAGGVDKGGDYAPLAAAVTVGPFGTTSEAGSGAYAQAIRGRISATARPRKEIRKMILKNRTISVAKNALKGPIQSMEFQLLPNRRLNSEPEQKLLRL